MIKTTIIKVKSIENEVLFFSIHYLKSIYKTRHSNIVSYNILIKID